jgi:hypothetical protein
MTRNKRTEEERLYKRNEKMMKPEETVESLKDESIESDRREKDLDVETDSFLLQSISREKDEAELCIT